MTNALVRPTDCASCGAPLFEEVTMESVHAPGVPPLNMKITKRRFVGDAYVAQRIGPTQEALDKAWALVERIGGNKCQYIIASYGGIEQRIDETTLSELVNAIQDARLAVQALTEDTTHG